MECGELRGGRRMASGVHNGTSVHTSGTWLGEGVGMDHGKGAGTTDSIDSAPVGPAGDAGPMRPGGTKTPFDLAYNHHSH
jgi:hypothetical protein